MECDSTIRSPWRLGMTLTCQRSDEHEEHFFEWSNGLAGGHVRWTGQDDKATAATRRRRAR